MLYRLLTSKNRVTMTRCQCDQPPSFLQYPLLAVRTANISFEMIDEGVWPVMALFQGPLPAHGQSTKTD